MKAIKLHLPPSKRAFGNFKLHLLFVLDQTSYARLSACIWGLGLFHRTHMIPKAWLLGLSKLREEERGLLIS